MLQIEKTLSLQEVLLTYSSNFKLTNEGEKSIRIL